MDLNDRELSQGLCIDVPIGVDVAVLLSATGRILPMRSLHPQVSISNGVGKEAGASKGAMQ